MSEHYQKKQFMSHSSIMVVVSASRPSFILYYCSDCLQISNLAERTSDHEKETEEGIPTTSRVTTILKVANSLFC